MGFFSWKTADTKESILNVYTGKSQTVYLLQPGGEKPICEEEYEGYGEFGGTDAYAWLARKNLPESLWKGKPDEDVRQYGITLDCGKLLKLADGRLLNVYKDDPKIWPLLGLEVEAFKGTWETKVPGLGKSPNQLVRDKEAKIIDVSKKIKVPLKFSFDEDAKYEDLPASKNCPKQGFFV